MFKTPFLKLISILALLGVCAIPAQALELEINRPQIQLLLNTVFPHQQTFGQWQVEFSQPSPSFIAANQNISLGVNVNVQDHQRAASAQGVIRGKLFFNPVNQELQVIKPALTEFKVTGGDAGLQKQMQDTLAQQVGQYLPVIVLFDIKKLIGDQPFLKPQSVTVIDDGISITF